MIETREAIQNLDSILDLEVGKVEMFYLNEIKKRERKNEIRGWTVLFLDPLTSPSLLGSPQTLACRSKEKFFPK